VKKAKTEPKVELAVEYIPLPPEKKAAYRQGLKLLFGLLLR
jgi:hypothetical protein